MCILCNFSIFKNEQLLGNKYCCFLFKFMQGTDIDQHKIQQNIGAGSPQKRNVTETQNRPRL
jgi:hypothetical protein